MYSDEVLRDLRLPQGQLGSISKERRQAAILEAQSWSKGPDQDHMQYHPISPDDGGLVVALGKPGKEAAPGYARPNPNDMLPSVLLNREPQSFLASFYDIFREFQHLGVAQDGRAPEVMLELVGALLFRSAFMLDHEGEFGGVWRWSPPESVMSILEAACPVVGEPPLPIRTYLYLIEGLALNEDVKYNRDGEMHGGTGRQNTLLTCVNVIGVVMDRVPIYRVFGGMTNARGVCPITQTEGKVVFPVLVGSEYCGELT